MKRALSRKNLWQNSPHFVRRMAGVLLRPVPQPWLLGRNFRQHLAFIHEAQWWPEDRWREYQVEQLHHILTLAYEKTRYYRMAFEQAGFEPHDMRQPEDLQGLPLIDKDTLREHMDDMLAIPKHAPAVDYTSTGGSSGIPIQFYIGRDRSSIEYAYMVAGWERVGYRLGSKLAVFRGNVFPLGGGHKYDAILKAHQYNNFVMSPDNLAFYFQHLRTIGPCFLHVYPSSAMTLARYAAAEGIAPPENIQAILSGSETIFAKERRFVEKVFGRRYYSWYGHSEKLVMAAECEHSKDYHVYPTYGYFELLDYNGLPVTEPGKLGEIVGTGFINKVIPFIRYRTGDYAEYVGAKCTACGREHPIIRKVTGRWPQGELIASDGSAISMTALNLHNDAMRRVKQYQFFQEFPGEAVLRVIPLPGFGEEDTQCHSK